MNQLVAQMTKEELQQIIETSVESNLQEPFGDPDEGLILREAVRKRLFKSDAAVKRGERGRPLDEIAKGLGFSSKEDK